MPPLTIDEAMQLAVQHHQAGRLQDAERLYRQVLTEAPGHATALHHLGLIAHQHGQNDIAIDFIRRAISLNPNSPEAHNNLANALKDEGRLDEAIAAYRQAIALKANLPVTQSNLGNAWKDKGELDPAIAAYRRAIELKPDYAEAYSNLGVALKDTGQLDEAIASYRQAIALKPRASELHSNLVYAVCFHPGYGSRELLQEAQAWAHQHADPLTIHVQSHDNERSPERALRIGYVTTHFCDHVVGRNILPVLENHDQSRFQIHCFSGLGVSDEITGRFRRVANGWHDIARKSDAEVTDLIRRERIDLLVDLNLHMGGTRLPVFARKPAPIQITWAGYPGTTGLKNIDYRLTDAYLDPPGQGDAFYAEQSIRLPHSFWCFRPSAQTPEVNPLPAASSGFVTFGCLNNFCKVTTPALDLWARVLQSVPQSRMRIRSPLGSTRERVLRHFEASGVDAQRINFIDHLSLPDYLRQYHFIDIGLDPLPYTGHSTSLDAFWMGVPVVTLAGATVASRGGVSIASNLGLRELIANTPDQYLGIAVKLAHDLERLRELRATLRTRMTASPLMDERRFTLDLEKAYRGMWRQWCSAQS